MKRWLALVLCASLTLGLAPAVTGAAVALASQPLMGCCPLPPAAMVAMPAMPGMRHAAARSVAAACPCAAEDPCRLSAQSPLPGLDCLPGGGGAAPLALAPVALDLPVPAPASVPAIPLATVAEPTRNLYAVHCSLLI